ncbi:hypothetical protein FA95DRAFT_1612775 [Auriscalpium vulgare]|uniref:Uncharacterized protein n=1 Tax=Auriscalpium vulgare TaxID=40419 RepID=A0ACB8R4Z2_9AGAM|nr:hypothetical protein FA95DRAFT_1612775 [Auriscalpium vulgare]
MILPSPPAAAQWACSATRKSIPSQDAWSDCLLVKTLTMNTCRTLFNASSGVVDPDLEVKGIRDLRVADTSIVPHALSSHPQIPVYIVGEHVAPIIDAEYNGPRQSMGILLRLAWKYIAPQDTTVPS